MTEQAKIDLPEWMGGRALAREIGISEATLRQYAEQGLVTRRYDKKYNVQEVLAHRAGIDPDHKARGRASMKARGLLPADAEVDDVDLDDLDFDIPESDIPALAISKSREAHFKAMLRELEYEKKRGDMIEREAVEAAVEAMGIAIQMRLKNLVPKLRPHLGDLGRELLENEIHAALTGMADDMENLAGEDDGQEGGAV